MSLFTPLIRTVLAADIVGTVELPAGLPTEIARTGDFLSAIFRFLIIVAGIFSLWQFLTGGLGIITGGADKGKLSEAQNKITMAILGLVIIAASFLLAGLAGQILFGSFTAILSPKLKSI